MILLKDSQYPSQHWCLDVQPAAIPSLSPEQKISLQKKTWKVLELIMGWISDVTMPLTLTTSLPWTCQVLSRTVTQTQQNEFIVCDALTPLVTLFWFFLILRILRYREMPFKLKSTVDNRGSFLLLTQLLGFCLYRGNYRILTSLIIFRDCGNSATISVRVWTFLIFLNFRCWKTFKHCFSVPFTHFLPVYFILCCCDNPGEENH